MDKVYCITFPKTILPYVVYVVGKTPGKAKHKAFLDATDFAGFAGKYIDLKAKRAPEFDVLTEKIKRGCYGMEYLLKLLLEEKTSYE